MFGKILETSEDEVIIENISGKVETQLLGIHLVFEEKHKILAEISNITKDRVTCLLKGEFEGNEYKSGLDHKPGSNSLIRAVTKDEVISIMGEQILDSPDSLYIGKNITYEGFNVSANINSPIGSYSESLSLTYSYQV